MHICKNKTHISIFLLLIILFFGDTYLYAKEMDDLSADSYFIAKEVFDQEKYEDAIVLFKRFLRLNPHSVYKPEVNFFIGQSYFNQNRFNDAKNSFSLILQEKDVDGKLEEEVLFWLSKTYVKLKQADEALINLNIILSKFPNSVYVPQAFLEIAEIYFEKKDFAKAYEFFEKLRKDFINTPYVQKASYRIMSCLYNQRKYQELKDFISQFRVQNVYSDILLVDFYEAEGYYYLNEFKEALLLYEKVYNSAQENNLRNLSCLGLIWANIKLNKFDDSLKYLKVAKSDSPTIERSLLSAKANCLFQIGQLDEAISNYDTLINRLCDPLEDKLDAYLGKIKSQFAKGSYKEAIDCIESVLTSFEKTDNITEEERFIDILSEIYFLKADIYEKLEDRKVATGVLNKLIAKIEIQDNRNPKTFLAKYKLAKLYERDGNFQEATKVLNEIIENSFEKNIIDDATYELGVIYFSQQDYNSARFVLHKLAKSNPRDELRLNAIYYLGYSYFYLGDYESAIKSFKDVVDLTDSQDLITRSKIRIAESLEKQDRSLEAIKELLLLRSRNPNDSFTPDILYRIARIYYNLNKLSYCLRYLDTIIDRYELYSDIFNVYLLRAFVYEREGNFVLSGEEFNNMIELYDKRQYDLKALLVIAEVLEKQGNIDKAIEYLERYKNKFLPKESDVYLKLANLYKKKSLPSQALYNYRNAIKFAKSQEKGDCLLSFASYLEELGDMNEAINRYFEIANNLVANSSVRIKALLRIASLYEYDKDWPKARKYYNELIDLDIEESKYAKERLDWIENNSNSKVFINLNNKH